MAEDESRPGTAETEQDEVASPTKTASTAHSPGDRPRTSEKHADEDAHVQILRAFQKKVSPIILCITSVFRLFFPSSFEIILSFSFFSLSFSLSLR